DGWSKNKFRDLAADKITVDGENTTRGKEEVKYLRKFAAGEMNRIAQRDKLEVKTEHLSYKERGIDKEPTKKMGYVATQAERRGIKTERGDLNRAIKASNDNLGNTTIQLQDQKTRLVLEQKRALLALEQERGDEDGEGSGTWQSTVATFKKEKSFPFHQRRVEQTQSELDKAKDQLEAMSLIDRMVGKKVAFEAEIQAKETNLKEATDALEEIKRKESSQPIDSKEQDKKLEHTNVVTAQRTAQYKEEQGEAVALQAQLESRNNIDKIIGAITGKTREQQKRIEELQGNIKSYEADKRLEEIKQQQVDCARQEAESKQRDQDRSNDNKVEVTKEQRIEAEKQKYLDDMAAGREEKDRQEAIKKGYDYQPMSERRENDMSLSKDERKQAYIERMDKQREQEAAHKEKEREAEKLEYEARPENNPDLSREDRKQAYLDRCASEREEQRQSPEIDKGDRGRE
ncbi:MAG: MobA/MobL family protein, partial [Gammaproteobacteria bacterium]|nr:MobA/MobL family protein [Gammaproteobacteria bacterium]